MYVSLTASPSLSSVILSCSFEYSRPYSFVLFSTLLNKSLNLSCKVSALIFSDHSPSTKSLYFFWSSEILLDFVTSSFASLPHPISDREITPAIIPANIFLLMIHLLNDFFNFLFILILIYYNIKYSIFVLS